MLGTIRFRYSISTFIVPVLLSGFLLKLICTTCELIKYLDLSILFTNVYYNTLNPRYKVLSYFHHAYFNHGHHRMPSLGQAENFSPYPRITSFEIQIFLSTTFKKHNIWSIIFSNPFLVFRISKRITDDGVDVIVIYFSLN